MATATQSLERAKVLPRIDDVRVVVRVAEVEEERKRLLRTAMDCHCTMVVWGYPGGAEHELDKSTVAAAAAAALCWDIR